MRFTKLPIAFCFLIAACHSTKKTTAPVAQTPVTPPTVVAPADTAKPEPVKQALYRASNKRSSDILHTRLEVSFDWTKCYLNGRATLEVKPYFYPTNMLYLDARGMEIRRVAVYDMPPPPNVRMKGKPAEPIIEDPQRLLSNKYVYENDSLKIELGKTFTEEQHYYVVVDYVAKPNELKTRGSSAITEDKGLYFVNPTGENPFKMPQIWTQGETQANSVWMPTIDSPNEKMTQEILITVEERFITLSNGLLVDSKKNVGGTRTDHWKLDQPHAPYLAMMAVGEFQKVSDTPLDGKEISFYVEREYVPHAMGIFGDTKEMVQFFSARLGVPYAWPKYAQIAVRDYVSGAMENTSATLHGDFVVYQTTREMIDGKKGEDVISHELFHQWFGDLVTCESWSNLPLNESFATYGEYLWQEHKHGRDAADYHHWQGRQGYLRSQKEVDLVRFNYKDKEDMFDAFSYNKGGQVLHMLRKAVGDDAFFASLKNYLETNRYKSAEIHHLRLAFEETTGRDMNWFFNQWFLNKGRPKLKVSQSYSNGSVELSLEQTQDLAKNPLYVLPLEIDVYVNGKAERHHIEMTEQKQSFTLKAAAAPQLVNFDAERQLLCNLDYVKTTEEYIFQYKNAPLFEDRQEALEQLEPKLQEDAVYTLFKDAALNDKFSGVRNFALVRLEKGPADKLSETKSTLVSIYRNDKRTKTRARALEILNKKFAKDPEVNAINEQALTEASYAICGEALEAIAQNNPKLAMEKARQFEGEHGKDVMFPIANLYATNGADEQMPFFRNSIKYINGFEMLSFISAYVKTTRRCVDPSNAIATAMDLEGLSKGAGKFQKFGILKGMKDLASAWEGRETSAKAKLEAAKKDNRGVLEAEKELKAATETKDILNKMYNRSK